MSFKFRLLTLHSIVDTIGRTSIGKGINKHALLITKTKSWEDLIFVMGHYRFAYATQVLLCKPNQ